MAESKKTSGGTKKTAHQTRNEAAEALRQAAELIASLNSQAEAETTTKKPAAKKSTAKSGASKAPAKKPTTKKPATKAAPKQEATEDQPQKKFGNRRSDCKNCGAENDKYALVCHACGAQLPPLPEGMVPPQPSVAVEEKPVEQPAQEAPVVEQAPVEEQPAETPVEQKAEEPVPEKAEEPAVEQKPAEQKAEEPAPAPAPKKKGGKLNAAMDKTSNFINNKGKLPLWIVANSLLLLSSIFLIIGAFSLSYLMKNGQPNSFSCSVFQYFSSSNAAAIKTLWQGTAGEWANGGYVMLGILMFLAFLVPLALIVKNVLLLVLKKNKNVHMLDAIITFAFLLAYLGVIGMYGANTTWAHLLAFIMAIILLAYTIFVILLNTRGNGKFPFFSIANLLVVMLCVFLLTNAKVYNLGGWYAARAAAYSGGGGFAFIMLLFALAALILLVVMQVKKLPGKITWLFEFLVPATAGVLAFIALVSFAGGKPDGLGMGPAFVVGAVFTMLLAIADVVFALVPKLHKFNVKVADRTGAVQAQPAVVQPVATEEPAEQPAEEPKAEEPVVEQKPEPAKAGEPKPAPTPTADGGANKCPSCGLENEADSLFCIRCGRKLK